MTDALKPGIYPNTPRHVYDSWKAVNYSMLKGILPPTTPAKFKWNLTQPREVSDPMKAGDWIDALLYDDERLKTDFIRIPEDMPNRPSDRQLTAKKNSESSAAAIAAWAAFDAERGDRREIPAKLYDEAKTIVEIFNKHPVASIIRDAPHKQLAIVWKDKVTGLLCKGLIDTVAEYAGWVSPLDVKTVGDSADEHNFARRGRSLHYPMQAWMYLDGLNTLAPFRRRWLWIVIERHSNFEIATYYADEAALAEGEHDFRLAIETYANCVETDHWPSYPVKPQPYFVPGWKRKELGL